MARIVILSAFLSPLRSGAEACAEEVAVALGKEFDIAIVTAKMRRDLPRTDMLRGSVPVVRVGIGHAIDKWLFPFLAPLAVRKLQPKIIHAVLESYAGLAMVLCRWLFPEAKRILTCQSTNTALLLGLMHRSADRVTVISSVLRERARVWGVGRGASDEAELIPNGISYRALRDAAAWEKKIPGRVLFVGRLEAMKGVDILLTAFAEIRNPKHEIRNVHLRIIGDGSERLRLEAMARDLGLADRVEFTGYIGIPTIHDEFGRAEIFCGLSRSEALGNVFLEAQAAGCAVVATRTGGIPDIVEDGVTGLLVPADDTEAAAAALAKLSGDPELRSRLAHAGADHAAAYDWKAIADRYATVYRSLL